MGTRALVRVFQDKKEILCLYRQNDGYPEGLGQELRDFVASKALVNGIPGGMAEQSIANGMGCLAAQLLVHLKGENVGAVYVYAPGSEDCGEEYEYHVRGPSHGEIDAARGKSPVFAQVTGYSVRGGYDGKPRQRRLVTEKEWAGECEDE
jgi:hypothetical protein